MTKKTYARSVDSDGKRQYVDMTSNDSCKGLGRIILFKK
jgi:hypothetical protein